ncbi:MAG: hypothetical protein ACYDFU_07655 [Nitrospirota bacterium]
MRLAITLTEFFVLIVFSCTPVFAAEQQEVAAQEQAVQPSCVDTGGDGGQKQELQAQTCAAPKKGICTGADMSFLGKYVSRGVTMTDGPVFEPDAWVSYKRFTATVWANMDLTDKNHKNGKFTEFDFTLDYSASLGKLGLSGGAIYYDFISAKNTAEVYGAASYDMFLTPKLVVYYDYWQVDGFYGVFSMGHCFCLPQPTKWMKPSLALFGQIGWGSKNYNSFNWGAKHSAFTDMVLTTSLPVSIPDHFTVTPTLSYSTVLDRTIRTKNYKNDNIIWGAVISANL